MFPILGNRGKKKRVEVVSNDDVMYGVQQKAPKDHLEAAHMHNVKLLARYTERQAELENLIAMSREELEQVETVIASLEQAQTVLDADFKQRMDAAAHEAVNAQIA